MRMTEAAFWTEWLWAGGPRFGSSKQANPPSARLSRRRSRSAKRKLFLEVLEDRKLMASLPTGAMSDDLAEYMLGRVAVTPVLLESNGSIDTNTLDWTAEQKTNVLNNIQDGLKWWTDLLATKSSVHTLEWVFDTTYVDNPVSTGYEPINRTSNEYVRWVPDFFTTVGLSNTTDIETNIRSFNNTQRTKLDTDWSFTIFVVNSQEGQVFAPGGSFSRAFAFAGGLFFVIPSNRPASTYTHETGHMFWALDEYQGGSDYTKKRGYYNAQNTNAIDLNPDPQFVQAPSIMSSGATLQTAYDTLITDDSTLALIGWKDSDDDGIFDVLDVPIELDGVGSFDPAKGEYKFDGQASVQAFPNQNSSGLQNDITLNKVTRIEYRLGTSGAWTSIAQPNASVTNISVRIAIPTTYNGTIQIRAMDDRIGVSSAIFSGDVRGVDSSVGNGINGFIYSDLSNDGSRQSIEPGLSGWNVQIVDSNGVARDFQTLVEPDSKNLGKVNVTDFTGVTLRAFGNDSEGDIFVATNTNATTGSQVFAPRSAIRGRVVSGWTDDDHNLEARFDVAQQFVSVDVFGVGTTSYARLELYSAGGVLLDRINSPALSEGQAFKLVGSRPSAEIGYVVVKAHLGTQIGIDNLRYGAESVATTDSFGRFQIPGLPNGTYRVKATPQTNFTATSPVDGVLTATLTSNVVSSHNDFGFYQAATAWHNALLTADVNKDSVVTALDALIVINTLSRNGAVTLQGSSISTSAAVDVNNDGALSSIDILIVINYLARNAGSTTSASGEGNFIATPPVKQAESEVDGEEPPPELADLYFGEDFDPLVELDASSSSEMIGSDVLTGGLSTEQWIDFSGVKNGRRRGGIGENESDVEAGLQ